MNVLVGSCGSPLAQSIFKALITSKLKLHIHLSDISEFAAGFKMNNPSRNTILPLVKDSDYPEKFFDYATKNKIEIYFPVINFDFDFVKSFENEFKSNGIKVAACNDELYRICNDKLQSIVELHTTGLMVPDTRIAGPISQIPDFFEHNSYPVFLKPRFGVSSKDLFIVASEIEYNGIITRYPPNYFIVQQYLSSKEEYTVGVYRNLTKSFQECFILKRELKFGLSYSGMVIESPAIREYCLEIGRILDSEFSINVQLKLINDQPYVFEINPRLSSTTSVRAHFGFNEPEMMIKDLTGRSDEIRTEKRTGKFSRYWEEFYWDE